MKTKGKTKEELSKQIFQLESKLYRKTENYQLIEQNSRGKYFNLTEQRQLYSDIFSIYTKLISTTFYNKHQDGLFLFNNY